MSSTKLLLITSEFPPQPGGIGTHAYQLAKELVQHDVDVSVLTDQRSDDGKEEAAFDGTIPFKVKRIKRRSLLLRSYLHRMRQAKRLAKKHDVVLVSGKFSLWIGGLLSLSSNKRLLAVIHGSELLLSNSLLRKYTNWCLKRFDHVIAVSNFTLSLVEKLDLKHTSVIPNGFEIVQAAAAKKVISSELSIITVGNVTKRKGQHNVVKALPLLKEAYPKVLYHIVGIPTEKDNVLQLARELDVEEHIVFHGRVSGALKVELLEKAAIFLMLSESTAAGDVEGFGIAILEANAMGLPAIGAVGCGIEDAISEGKSGRLIQPDAPQACKAAIDEILKNYQYFSSQAIVWTEQFHWSELIKQYLILIKAT